MIEIDHNPHEKRPSNFVWWAAWIVVALGWILEISLHGWSSLNWGQISLGGLTMGILAMWAMEMTDNKIPSWMMPKPRKRYLPDPVPGEAVTGQNGKALFLVIPAFIALTVVLIWLT